MTTQLAPGRLGARRRARAGSPHVIGVVSGRGGSGVSLVAALLTLRSALSGYRALLVDADPWLDMQRIWLGLPKGPSLAKLRGGREGPEALVTQVAAGLEIVSFGGGETSERDDRTLVRRVASIFGTRDVVVVDAGSRLESLTRCADLAVGSVLVVSGADAVALASTHALAKALGSTLDARGAVLFNRTEAEQASAAAEVLSEGARRFLGTSIPVVGHLPFDADVAGRLAGGATLPESLLGSSLPESAVEVMRGLPPWRPA